MPTITALTGDAPRSEFGYAGIQPPPWSYYGTLDPEEVPQLRWPASIPVYHRMRTDSQIQSLSKGVTFPIRRWRWGIRPAGANGGARDEVVADVANALNLPVLGTDDEPRRVGFNHDDHLRHSLLGLWYGHMMFELVGQIVGTGASARWRFDKLAPRMPQSIQSIQTEANGDFKGIVQWGNRGMVNPRIPNGLANGTPIPASALAPYVWDREGANWIGRSAFRSLYKHWVLKDRLMRIDAGKNERFGLGITKGVAPQGASEGVVTEYGKMAQAVSASPSGGVGLANGADLFVEGVRGQLPDTIASMRYHDEAMARDFLMMFAQLGQTQTGSRALGDTFADFFDLSLDATAGWYCTVTDAWFIDRYVLWNYGPDEVAPAIGYERREDPELSVADIVGLIDAGLLTMDDDLEAWVRDRYQIGPRDPNTPAREAPNSTSGSPVVPRLVPESTPAAAAHRRRPIAAVSSQTLNDSTVGHREPTPIEMAAGTDFTHLQASWAGALRTLIATWQAIRSTQVDALVQAAELAVSRGDVNALATLAAPVDGADVIEAAMTQVYEEAATAARVEVAAQGLTAPFVTSSVPPTFTSQSSAVAALMARSLSNAAATNALQRYGVVNLDAAAVAAGLRDHLEALSDAYLADQLGGALTQAQNQARADVFAQMPDGTTFYASELLDQATCEPCAGADGTEYATLDDALADYPTGGYSDCDGGPRCRGTIVAVGPDETPSAT